MPFWNIFMTNVCVERKERRDKSKEKKGQSAVKLTKVLR